MAGPITTKANYPGLYKSRGKAVKRKKKKQRRSARRKKPKKGILIGNA